MAVTANRAPAMKNLVTVISQQLPGGTLIKSYQSLIYLKNSIIPVVNRQGVGKAVKDPEEKFFAFQGIWGSAGARGTNHGSHTFASGGGV
jgi:hypothetical protein